ncbi:MAG: peptidoglycan-binding protein [bacterium]|nr:peptidoglycan-binding protein [bacterium]
MKKYFSFSFLLTLTLVFILGFITLSSVKTVNAVESTCTSTEGWDSANGVPCAVVAVSRTGTSGTVTSSQFLPNVNYKPSASTISPVIKRNVSDQSTGTLLQAYLFNQGFVNPGDSLDGIAGPKTVAAITAFQKATKGALVADGQVGPSTWAYIAVSQGIHLKSADDRTLEALKVRYKQFHGGVPKAERVSYNARRVLTQLLTVPSSIRALSSGTLATANTPGTTTTSGAPKKINKNYICVTTSTYGKYCKFVGDEDALAIANGTKTAEQVLLGKAPTPGTCLQCYCVIPENLNDPVCKTLVLTEGDQQQGASGTGFAGSCGPGSGGNNWIQGTPIPHNPECIPRGPNLTAAITYDNVFTAYTYKTNASGSVTSIKPFCSDMNWLQSTSTAMNIHKGWKSPEACSTAVAADDAGVLVSGEDDNWIGQAFLGVVTIGGVQYPTGDAHWQRMKSTVPGPKHPAGFSEAVVIEQMNQGTWGDSLDIGANGMAPWGVIAGDGLASARWLQVEDPGWKNFGIHRLKFCPTTPTVPSAVVTSVASECRGDTPLTWPRLDVTLKVTLDKEVDVTGVPQLQIRGVASPMKLPYVSSSTDKKTLIFRYLAPPQSTPQPYVFPTAYVGNGTFEFAPLTNATIKNAGTNVSADISGNWSLPTGGTCPFTP